MESFNDKIIIDDVSNEKTQIKNSKIHQNVDLSFQMVDTKIDNLT